VKGILHEFAHFLWSNLFIIICSDDCMLAFFLKFADMWAVGAILAELFTLTPLFPGERYILILYFMLLVSHCNNTNVMVATICALLFIYLVFTFSNLKHFVGS